MELIFAYKHTDIFIQEEPASSIGAKIKQPAVDLHNTYMDNKELITAKQISIMVLGLSSIFDLGNKLKILKNHYLIK